MADKLDKFLAMGAMLDWVTAANTVLQDVTNGPSCIFYIDAFSGFSVNDIKKVLRKHKISFWGAKFLDNYLTVTVMLSDAECAKQKLLDAGFTVM